MNSRSRYLVRGRIALGALLVLMLHACGSLQRSTSSGVAVEQTKTALLRVADRERTLWQAIRGNMQATVSNGSREFSSRINVVAVRGRGIRLAVIPFPLIEAARLWFTPEGVTFVDLMNDKYAEESYATFSERVGFSIDYDQIEALLLGRVFVPGKRATDPQALHSLSYSVGKTGEGTHELRGSLRGATYTFDFGADAILRGFTVYTSSVARFRASYTGAVQTEGGRATFPEYSTFSLLESDGRSVKGSLSLEWRTLSEVSSEESLPITPIVTARYERIPLDVLLRVIDKL